MGRRKVKEIDIDIAQLCQDIEASSPETAIYVGADSKTFKKGKERWCAYCVTVVMHFDGKHGGRIYKDIKIERDYGDGKSPRMRLMNEVYKVVAIAGQIADSVGSRPFEIHLDVNPDPQYKSNAAVREACGYVLGTFGFEAKIKPDAWCASAAADRFAVKTANNAKQR